MKRSITFIILSLALFLFMNMKGAPELKAASSQDPTEPIVPRVVIIPPEQGLSADKAYLSGLFHGELRPNGWVGRDPTMYTKIVVVVKKINANTAEVVYYWGDAPTWNVTAGKMEFTATFQEGKLRYSEGDKTWLLYRENGAIIFERLRPGYDLKAIMTKRN